jgi:hypothetical protein
VQQDVHQALVVKQLLQQNRMLIVQLATSDNSV